MEKIDNKFSVPFEHYKSIYRELDPQHVSARCGASFAAEKGEFLLNYLSREVVVGFPEFALRRRDSGENLSDASNILLIRFLIEGAACKSTGKFLSYAEVPWGEVYLANFKGRCIERLAFSYGNKLEEFAAACTALGGTAVEAGDVAFDIEFLENYIVRLIIWTGDDEFPPSSQILFSDNFPLSFTAEDLAGVGDVVIGALKTAL